MASSIRNLQITRKSFISLVLLLGTSAILNTVVAVRASTTIDEPHHIEYGSRILHFEPDRLVGGICDSQMPVSALNAAPSLPISIATICFTPSLRHLTISRSFESLPFLRLWHWTFWFISGPMISTAKQPLWPLACFVSSRPISSHTELWQPQTCITRWE